MTCRPSHRSLATVSVAALLVIAGCGDDTDSPSGANDDGSDATSTGIAGSAGDTSDPDSDGSTAGAGDSADSTDSADSADGSDGQTTDAGADNCASADLPQCPPAPGAISTDDLDALMLAGAVTVVDVRGTDAFEAGHIGGASVIDAADLRATVDGVSGQVAPPEQAQMVLEAAGLQPEDTVVVYSATNDTAAARVVWTLRYYGHTGKVWTLDGGLDQWTSEAREIQSESRPIGASSYAPQVVDALRVDAPWVLDHLDDPSVTLVDARSDAEFADGHIPGALSVDWVTNLDGAGLYRSTDELQALYGPPPQDQTLVVYCQTGSRASVDWLVLTMLGYDDVRIYDGSWSEWSANPKYPQR